MATSHSGWGNCPAHKKNQLAMYPGVWCILTSVFSVISVGGMWQWVGWEYEPPVFLFSSLSLRGTVIGGAGVSQLESWPYIPLSPL